MALRHFQLALAAQGQRATGDVDLKIVFGQSRHIGAKHEVLSVVLEADRARCRHPAGAALVFPKQAIELASQLAVRALAAAKIRETETGPIIEVTETREHG